jgi:hypothetical protein
MHARKLSHNSSRRIKMPKLEMTIPHRLSQPEALQRLRTLIPQFQQKYGKDITELREQWQDSIGTFSFKVKGFSVSGTLTVEDCQLKLSGNLPLVVTFHKEKIETAIREEAARLLA